MPRLIISDSAERDLTEIGDYIALDNPARARSFVEEIAAKAAQAAERPGSLPARDDLSPGLRVARHRRYLLFFTHDDNAVRLERVLHGARDLRRVLKE